MAKKVRFRTMFGRLLDAKVLAFFVSCFLGVMIVVSSSSSTPTVRISEVVMLDVGQKVITYGILVDLHVYDSGAEVLQLVDGDDGSALKVVSSPGVKRQPSDYIDLGDKVRVVGEVAESRVISTVYTSSDQVRLAETSESVLTVEILSRNWILFLEDRVHISGVLLANSTGAGLRLFDADMESSVLLRAEGLDVMRLGSKRVLVDGVLRFDRESMALFIDANSLSVADGNPFLDVHRWAFP